MKKTIVSISAFLLVACLMTQCFGGHQYPTGKISARVIDESGIPISNVTVSAGWSVLKTDNPWDGRKGINTDGVTDEKGLFEVTCSSLGGVTFTVIDPTCYTSYYSHKWVIEKNMKWQPWGLIVPICLRKIENPIAMFAKSFLNMECPSSFEYDFIKGDFMPPHGRGEVADAHFEFSQYEAQNEYDKKMSTRNRLTVTFLGEFNGFTPIADDAMNQQSELRFPRFAYEGDYSRQMIDLNDGVHAPSERNLFFRIRSEKNDDGTFKSAFYGKMRSPESIEIWFEKRNNTTTHTIKNFVFYVNPIRNDRNMEYDAKHNNNLSYPREPSWKGEGYWTITGYKNGERQVEAP